MIILLLRNNPRAYVNDKEFYTRVILQPQHLPNQNQERLLPKAFLSHYQRLQFFLHKFVLEILEIPQNPNAIFYKIKGIQIKSHFDANF